MMTLRSAGERGHANHGWLDSWFTFSFADYYDSRHMHFRALRVINDDRIAPGGGFGMHPHRDMEIISYVLAGALEHQDSMGNRRVIRAGDFQYMSAGSGVTHSEFNPSNKDETHLLQMWIMPNRKGTPPRYAEKSAAELSPGKIHLIASASGRDGSITLFQDAEISLARLNAGDQVAQELKAARHVWLHVAEGEAVVNGQRLVSGDAAALSGESAVRLEALATSQVLVFDLN